MPQYNPIFRSPVAVSSVPSPASGSSWHLSDLTGVPVILLQGDVSDLLAGVFADVPARPGDLISVASGLLARLTPDQFYLFGLSLSAALPTDGALDERFARAQRFAHAADYTHGKAVLRLAGRAAPDLLSKICGLDFHEQAFPNRRVAQTSAAKIHTLIARYDGDGTPVYYLHV
ncbi:MAG: hypothetical protein IT330_02335, partial [Anaerolineae bacterium]|nr:hypothetical protein [Anaerolineae bacterium]